MNTISASLHFVTVGSNTDVGVVQVLLALLLVLCAFLEPTQELQVTVNPILQNKRLVSTRFYLKFFQRHLHRLPAASASQENIPLVLVRGTFLVVGMILVHSCAL